jgi:hypothetical protein
MIRGGRDERRQHLGQVGQNALGFFRSTLPRRERAFTCGD